MASTPTAPCLPNKSQNDSMRILTHQELNKVSSNSRIMQNNCKRGAENKDPNQSTKPAKGPNKLTGISRLPVLAKSQQSAVKNISLDPAHRRWEERPLLGKAQKTKRCPKPVNFSLSQSQTHNQKCNEASSKSTDKSGKPKTHLTRCTPAKSPNVSRPGSKTDVVQNDLSTKLGNITLAHTQLPKNERCSLKTGGFKDQAESCLSTKQTIQSCVTADGETGVSERGGNVVASSQTPLVSKCSSGPDSSVYLPQRVSVKKKGGGAEAISESAMLFSPDPLALRSILLNEGIKVRGCDVATPRVSTCPSAQRVPMRKPQTHTAATFGKAEGSAVAFSPDPLALHSIMLNEGLKQGAVRTPRACPSARAPSVYSARRVPVKKTPSETSNVAGTVAFSPDPSALLGSSVVKTPRVHVCPARSGLCTAQRVPVKKDRAGEAVHTGITQTSGRRWAPHQVPASKSHAVEEVVQRLFQEEPEQMENSEDEVTSGQKAHHQLSAESKSKINETERTETEPCLPGIDKLPAAQPFIQAPNRQSVIVFSSGQKLLPRNGASIQTSQHAAQLQPFADRTSRSQSKLILESNRPVTPGKQCRAKASTLSLAVCALKRRLPPLEDMFLDEECAMYTSRQQSWLSQARCLNPVASTLLFQDSTCFVPIIMTARSLNPVPQISSPIKV